MTSIASRLKRMQRDCDVSVGPVWVMAAACALLIITLSIDSLVDDQDSPQLTETTQALTAKQR